MADPKMRKDCPMRGSLGNCSPVGGFCMGAVSDEICEALHNAYDHGVFDAMRTLKERYNKALCHVQNLQYRQITRGGEVRMNTKKKNALFGRYPSCDMLNNALRFIHEGKIDAACQEIVFAIEKADGYFYEDIVPIVEKIKSDWMKTHSERR